MPAEDRNVLTALSDRVTPLLGLSITDEERQEAIAAAEEMHAYLGALLEQRRRTPRDDLLSALLAAEEDGAKLSPAEMLSLAATLYSAGHRTTRDLFANGLTTLLAEPERYAAVVERWPGLCLASSEIPVSWHLRGPFRGVDELLVRTN